MSDPFERAAETAWRLRNSRAVTLETVVLVFVATTVPVYLTFTRYGSPIVEKIAAFWWVVVLVPVLVSGIHVLAALHDVRQYPEEAPESEIRVFAHALGLRLFTLHFLVANMVFAVIIGVGFLPTLVLVPVGLYAAVLFGLSSGGIRDSGIEETLQAQQP